MVGRVTDYKSVRTSRTKYHLNWYLDARACLAKVWGESVSELQTLKPEAENNLARSQREGKEMELEGWVELWAL